ncbi:MAG: trigger factor [Thalassolituus sp.]|uniref:Trigger factor n=1 Tax=Thalassolituus oleivorans MIL-1 TaxID=1298593 RepID=M5DRX6_9GAMM|nr:trigger factor [Thalassolituus oleivorans]AHK15780.1 trigger factor [Thalassolituus oleivorans R6-15]APR67062.1 trigger factor [Thalassolituus oleivorans]MBQ0726477.1 trigger factor [Thalassolituus oleivorans]MBQ0779653.1 trigger factor [Thalassolituus oleivorans]MCA6128679.1 trigger factor [Thalassolituus oleivorans 4BN06-13]
MQVSIETTSGLQRCMTIGVPAAEVEEKVVVELKKLSKGRRIDGFRAGKIPPAVAKKMFGKQARYEAIYQQMQQSFFKAVQDEDLKLAGMPNFEPTVDEDGKDLEFKATFEVYPEITLADFSAIEVEQKAAEVTDADLENMLTNLQKQHAKWEESTEAAVDGDQVVIDFEGFIDGEAFEGGKAAGYSLTLGSNSMIPGFETGLVGAKAGEEKTLDVAFPEDYHKEELKGKPAQFKVSVQTVKKPELPELNAEFFGSFGIETADLAEFKSEIRKNMDRELARGLRNLAKQQVIAGLVESNNIDVPASLVDQEIDRLRQQAVQQFGGGQKFDMNMLPKELFKEQAEKRVAIGLLMNAAIEANELTPSAEKVEALIEEVAASYQDPEEVRTYYNTNPQQKAQVEALALEEQVVEKVLAQAKVSQVESNYEEVIRLVNQSAR